MRCPAITTDARFCHFSTFAQLNVWYMRIVSFMLLLSFISMALSKAQTADELDTILVQASLIPAKISETGRNITVIDSKQIAALPATSIDEILQFAPGVEIQSRGGFGVQADILIRGSTFTQVLILIDGMKINDPLTGHFNSYFPVTPAEIERIEILRGAAAALFGADAVGGVINIVTKSFSKQKGDNHSQIRGNFHLGERELVNGQQGFFFKKGRQAFGGGFLLNRSIGQIIPAQSLDSATILDAYQTDFDIKTFSLSYAYEWADGLSLRLRSTHNNSDFNARYFYTNSPLDKSREQVASWFNQLQLKKIRENSVTDLNLAYKYNTDEFIFSPDFPSTNTHQTAFWNFIVNHQQVINRRLYLKMGVQADRRTIESNDRGNHEDHHIGAYLMGAYHHRDLHLTGSWRVDYDENYGLEWTPQLNASYISGKTVFRGAIGRSIRAADYTERFVSNNLKDLSPLRNLGNPDLKAESSWSYEIGLDRHFTQGLVVKTTVFLRQSDQLIDYVLTNERDIGSVSETGSLTPGADYFFARNISDITTRGWEVDVQWSKDLAEELSIFLSLSYTYLDTDNPSESVYLSNHSRHLVNTQLRLLAGNWMISMGGLFKERNELLASSIGGQINQNYFLSNGRLSYQTNGQLALNLQVQNIGDISYQNILGAPMPSRWFMAGVSWNLKMD